MSPITREWIRGLPKPELHVHLEGTISPEAYVRIAKRNGIEPNEDPAAMFKCTDFESFLRAFLKVVRVLRQPQDFAEITYDYLKSAAADGVRHVELFLSPATQRKFVPDLNLEHLVHAVAEACGRAESNFGMSSLLLFDMVRNLGEGDAFEDLELAQRCRGYRVVGVGLGGDERNFPARDFQAAFAKAEELGLHRTVHAGEAAGPESIKDAVELLHAERIGHGVSARGDKATMELLRANSVAIDACPTSNVVTGAVRHIKAHPLYEFLSEGLLVTLSSDDPAFFGASLVDEYVELADQGFPQIELVNLARNGFKASFAPAQLKRTWLGEIDRYVTSE
ncbi:MAG TPA: adenosine deaminase [Candidatus Eremiobacteraceae bacterium]|nr:adenosine deaminase [Candidatus Eremiobacteraceae bacterium]